MKREEWTGEVVKQMHLYDISAAELAREMSCSKAYVGMLLNGTRTPKGGRERVEAAFEQLRRRKEESYGS